MFIGRAHIPRDVASAVDDRRRVKWWLIAYLAKAGLMVLQASTRPFTASTDVANIFFSSSLNSISTIFSIQLRRSRMRPPRRTSGQPRARRPSVAGEAGGFTALGQAMAMDTATQDGEMGEEVEVEVEGEEDEISLFLAQAKQSAMALAS
jgi:hypothetical protein